MRAALRRVQRLETLAPPKAVPVLDRLAAALDEAARRLMGVSYESVKDDDGAWDLILPDLTSGFCRRLSQADEDLLIAELERIAGVSASG